MGTVVDLDGAAAREACAAPSVRQPVDGPVSQWVSLGEAAINLLAKLESRMNERAITKP